MSPFMTTIQIVSGILFPIAALILLVIVAYLLMIAAESVQKWRDDAKKQAPFDTVESSISFQDDSLHIRLVRKGVVVFEDDISRSDLES